MGCGATKQKILVRGVPADLYFQQQILPDVASILPLMNLKPKEAMMIFIEFARMDADVSGQVSLEEFYKYYGLKRTLYNDRVFGVLDVDGSGQLDFREFLIGLWCFCSQDAIGIIRSAFELLDPDKTGLLSIGQVDALLRMMHGTTTADSSIMAAIHKIDADQDGLITVGEFVQLGRQHRGLMKPVYDMQFKLRNTVMSWAFWHDMELFRKSKYRADDKVEVIISKHRGAAPGTIKRKEPDNQSLQRGESKAGRALTATSSRTVVPALSTVKSPMGAAAGASSKSGSGNDYGAQFWVLASMDLRTAEDAAWNTLSDLEKQAVEARRVVDDAYAASAAIYREMAPQGSMLTGERLAAEFLFQHQALMQAVHQVELAVLKYLPLRQAVYQQQLTHDVERARAEAVQIATDFAATSRGKGVIKSQLRAKKLSGHPYKPRELTYEWVRTEYIESEARTSAEAVLSRVESEFETDQRRYQGLLDQLLYRHGIDDSKVNMKVWQRRWHELRNTYFFYCPTTDVSIYNAVPQPGEEDPDFEALQQYQKYQSNHLFARVAMEAAGDEA